MNTTELKERIEKKQEQINKIQKRLNKWLSNKDSEKEFEKEYSWLNTFEERKDYFKQEWIEYCDREIRCAQRDLEDAQLTIDKYQNALMLEQEKEDRPVIKIFKDFFDNWKEEIKEFAEYKYNEYRQVNHEYCELWNKHLHDEETKERLKALDRKEKDLLSITWVSLKRDKSNSEFDKFLDKYMQDRYYELVEKVTKITGTINNVDDLYVGNDGSLNGIIVGDNGKAKIETIIAGGYNQNIVVNVKHGQCRHYRVLVHEVR